MKYLIYGAAMMLAACGTKSTSSSSETGAENLPTKPTSTLKKQKACEAISMEEIAAVFQVSPDQIVSEDMMSTDRRSNCYFYSKDGIHKIYLRLAWSSEKAIENKALERKFKQYLERGERNMTYKDVSSTSTVQVLHGEGPEQMDQYAYIIRKRYGLEAELQVEYLGNKSDATWNKLLKLASKIQ